MTSLENKILGRILLNNSFFGQLNDLGIQISDFSDEAKIIFQAMTELVLENEPIDLVTLTTKLRSKTLLDYVGANTLIDLFELPMRAK